MSRTPPAAEARTPEPQEACSVPRRAAKPRKKVSVQAETILAPLSVSQREIVVDLPLPDRCLHPNSATTNGFARSRARKAARKIAYVMTMQAMGDLMRPAPWYTLRFSRVRATLTFRGVRRDQDSDNAYAWEKSHRDGIADALLGGSDHDWEWVGEPRYEKGAAGVTITVREAREGGE